MKQPKLCIGKNCKYESPKTGRCMLPHKSESYTKHPADAVCEQGEKQLPLWQKPLDYADLAHLKGSMEPVTLAGFFRNRDGQKRMGIRCIECEIIETKVFDYLEGV